ncbi:putative metallo-beta-lactamase domain protein [Xylaria flabelliformis]|nr:putative metallo-beta-lactamase domain protein [Xylaria flabelliformis]
MSGVGGYKQINTSLIVSAFEDYLSTQFERLPKLPDVELLSSRVIRVLGQNPGKFTLQGTNTYIVGSGSSRLIIDTGQGNPEWAHLIASTLETLGIKLCYVLLTHWHGDHTGGVPDLLRLYPHLSTAIYKNSPAHGQRDITDGQVFSVEGATVRSLYTPGHSHDHMSFILEEERAMFTGDNILGHGTTAFEDLDRLMVSWNKMQEEDCLLGYPAHGIVISDLRWKIEREISLKINREDRVLQALQRLRPGDKGRGESVSIRQLASLIYGKGVSEEVRNQAVEPLTEEVLQKLAEDGKVGFEMRNGERLWFGF